MAAASVVIRRRNSDAVETKQDFSSIASKALPDLKDWVADFSVQMLMLDGIWRHRKIMWTKENLFIMRHDSLEIMDTIPLHEIFDVSLMNDDTLSQHSVMTKMPCTDSQEHGRECTLGNKSEFFVESSATHLFNIQTLMNGINAGRTYYLSTRHLKEAESERRNFVTKLSTSAANARRKAVVKSRWQRAQDQIRTIYQSLPFQGMVAVLITANFVANAAQAQMNQTISGSDGAGSDLGDRLDQLDIFFTAIFAAELVINAFAHWFRPFVGDGWNLFDLLVVSLSLAALGPISMPVNVLRSMRAFRVVRLFGRLRSLRDIVDALTSGIIPVLNALLILFVVTSIYSIVGVTFFDSRYPDHFGRFDVALATLFALAAGLDGLMTGLPDLLEGGSPTGLCYFVATFVVIVNWTLLQICVAVLLDSFLTARSRQDNNRETQEMLSHANRNTFRSALDPLLEILSRDYVDDADLSRRMLKLFKTLDSDDSKGLSCKEFKAGIRKLNIDPPIHMSDEDFTVITDNGKLLDQHGQLSLKNFQAVMLSQIRLFIQRQMSNTLIAGASSRFEVAQLSSMKALHHDITRFQDQQTQLFCLQERLAEQFSYLQQDVGAIHQHLNVITAGPIPAGPTPASVNHGLFPAPAPSPTSATGDTNNIGKDLALSQPLPPMQAATSLSANDAARRELLASLSWRREESATAHEGSFRSGRDGRRGSDYGGPRSLAALNPLHEDDSQAPSAAVATACCCWPCETPRMENDKLSSAAVVATGAAKPHAPSFTSVTASAVFANSVCIGGSSDGKQSRGNIQERNPRRQSCDVAGVALLGPPPQAADMAMGTTTEAALISATATAEAQGGLSSLLKRTPSCLQPSEGLSASTVDSAVLFTTVEVDDAATCMAADPITAAPVEMGNSLSSIPSGVDGVGVNSCASSNVSPSASVAASIITGASPLEAGPSIPAPPAVTAGAAGAEASTETSAATNTST